MAVLRAGHPRLSFNDSAQPIPSLGDLVFEQIVVVTPCPDSPVSRSERRQNQQIEGRGTDQAAQYNQRHGAFDFMTGYVHPNRQRQQTQTGDERSHQDGGEPVGRASHGGSV